MLKQLVILASLSLSATAAWSQKNRPDPIQWKFSAQKIADKTFEIHITGKLESGWHAYSQLQPKEAVAQPTVIKFVNNPIVVAQGKIKEVGALEKWQDKVSGIKANQYEDQIDFIQVVKIKADVKTFVSGQLTYQVCTDEMCLPPQTNDFNIPLGL